MSDWIEVPEALFGSICKAVADADASRVATVDVPPSLIDALIEYMGEDTVCDHSVNICFCEYRGMVEALEMLKEGYILCPSCKGDQKVWDAEAFETELEAIMKERNLRRSEAKMWLRNIGAAEDVGLISCPKCDGKGKVKYRD